MEHEQILPRSAEACYRAFCDVPSSRLWVPGLKRVRVIRADDAGHALEVWYEHESLSYALVYAYDDAQRKLRWVPSAGLLDGVSGYAQFHEHPDGCRFVYAVDSRRGRGPEHPSEVVRAFAEWISRGARP